jgi:hypothetical protein
VTKGTLGKLGQREQTQPYLDRKDPKGQLELIQLCLVLLGQLGKLDLLVQTQRCLDLKGKRDHKAHRE